MNGAELSYTIIDDGKNFDLTEIHRLLKEHGWNYVNQNTLMKEPNAYVDMVWVTAEKAPHDAWKIRCTFKNMLSTEKRTITDKKTLHQTIQRDYPKFAQKHIAITRLLKDVNDINDEVLIIRPSGRGFYSGNGVAVINTNEELQKIKKIYSHSQFMTYKKKMHAKTGENIDVIASKYITNPLLWNGYKFHLRMYLLIHTYPQFSYQFWETGKILTAKLPFKNEDYHNSDIHDTHLKSTPRNLFFPKDAIKGCKLTKKNIQHIYSQIQEIADVLGILMRDNAKTYAESKIGCEIFGLDLMITDDLNVILIEVNDRVGYAPVGGNFNKIFKDFCTQYFNWVYDNAIKPVEHDLLKKQ